MRRLTILAALSAACAGAASRTPGLTAFERGLFWEGYPPKRPVTLHGRTGLSLPRYAAGTSFADFGMTAGFWQDDFFIMQARQIPVPPPPQIFR